MIKVIEKFDEYGYPWHEYDNIEDERLKQFKPGIRVLPAAYFHQPSEYFSFIKQHEPGTPGWPKGGIECYDSTQGIRCFFSSQVIVHPAVFNEDLIISKSSKRGRPKKNNNQIDDKPKVKGKRGRPALSPEERKRRAKEHEYKPKGTGKRGRPPLSEEEKALRAQNVLHKPKGTGKRGRPPLSEEEKLKRKAIKSVKITNGKRGRPKKINKISN